MRAVAILHSLYSNVEGTWWKTQVPLELLCKDC
jgi:hypothetical protein